MFFLADLFVRGNVRTLYPDAREQRGEEQLQRLVVRLQCLVVTMQRAIARLQWVVVSLHQAVATCIDPMYVYNASLHVYNDTL